MRRLGSSVVFLNGHANASFIMFASSNTEGYRTGVHKSTESTGTMDGLSYSMAGVESTNMLNTNLITFSGCSTGAGSDNLVTSARNQGAVCVVGFSGNMDGLSTTGRNWLNYYNLRLAAGETVAAAISQATSRYPNCSVATTVMTRGFTNTIPCDDDWFSSTTSENLSRGNVLDTSTMQELMDNNDFLTVSKISGTFDGIEKNISKADLVDYETELKQYIEEITNYDEDFDIGDYKVSYNMFDQEGKNGYVLFTYYIDGKIETNKVYMANIVEGNVTGIILAGIEKENVENINTIESTSLINKIKEFENEKINEVKKMNVNGYKLENIATNVNNEITSKSLGDNVGEVSEIYFYDFNTNKMTYKLDFEVNSLLEIGENKNLETITSVSSLEIELN